MDPLRKRDFIESPYKSERDRVIKIQRWNVRIFFKLLDGLESFFEHDKCYRLADNYLIAMVFTYFLRASLDHDEYTRDNFFAALFLAYNMEEDEGEFLLVELEPWLECSVAELKRLRSELFQRVEYRAAVSRACCEVVMRCAKPEHPVWRRRRHVYHSGIVSRKIFLGVGLNTDEEVCSVCGGDNGEEYQIAKEDTDNV